MLADMWRRGGADTVIYTGAGLSTASGRAVLQRRGKEDRPWLL